MIEKKKAAAAGTVAALITACSRLDRTISVIIRTALACRALKRINATCLTRVTDSLGGLDHG